MIYKYYKFCPSDKVPIYYKVPNKGNRFGFKCRSDSNWRLGYYKWNKTDYWNIKQISYTDLVLELL